MFLGLYAVLDSKESTLFLSIKYMFNSLSLPLSKLQSYGFHRALNMSDQQHDVRAKLKEACSDPLYIPCSNPALNLVSLEAARNVELITIALNFV